MACSTCHVIVAKEDFARLPPAGEEEDDLLDLAWARPATSRLACQINLTRGAGHADRADAGRLLQLAGALVALGERKANSRIDCILAIA